jgi:type II secretory pathway component GspD/PulD (secretin)
LILGALGGGSVSAAPDDATASPSKATRQPPPAPPIKYLEAGAHLFNSAQTGADLDRASKYLAAADAYRDMLKPDDQAILDAYLKELASAKAKVRSGAATSPGNAPASTISAGDQPQSTRTAVMTNPVADPNRATTSASAANNTEVRQRGRWLLHEAREQLHLGNYDGAQQKADEAEKLDIKWGLFDDTPAKVTEEIRKARPKTLARAEAAAGSQAHDRQAAKAKMRDARTALNNRQFEQAEAIALEVKGWGLSYGMFEDNPDKIASAARALRRRDRIRSTPSKEQSSQGVYDILVEESRQLLMAGKYDEAEAKARKAQRMNVVPALTADRAESVLHEIAMARAQKEPVAGAPKPAAEPSRFKMEREANELLAKGDQVAAQARFAEAERLDPSNPSPAPASQPPVDLAVRKIAEGDAPAAPVLTPPADNPAVEPPQQAPNALAPQITNAAAPAPAAPGQPVAGSLTPTAPANRGEQLLSGARELYKSGNYQAARQLANEAKAGKFGVEAQSDELLAQIAMTEQGGALSLYESALAASQAGEIGRAKALLAEVTAAGDSLDQGLRAKVSDLLQKLSAMDANSVYESALAAMREGQSGRAKALLTEVASTGNSLDEGTRAKVSDLLQRLSTEPKTRSDAKTTAPGAQDADALAAQKLNAEVGTKIAEARRLQETDPDKAIAIYEQTMQAVQASGLSPDLTRPMVRRLEVAVELAKKDKVVYEAKMQDKALRAEIEMKRLRILEADKAKKIKMKELMDKATTAYAAGNYVECEAFAKQAMEVDPNEVAASMLVFKAKTERRFKQDLENRNLKENGAAEAFQDVDRASAVDPEVLLRDIRFPKTFKDLTSERRRVNALLEPKKDPKVLAIETKLKDRISMNMDKQPLSEAITFLQNYTGLNIVLDPKALNEEGLTSASTVSLVVNQIQLKTALKLLLRPLGLTYKIEDDVVLITSPQATQKETYPKTYYVGDLVLPPDKGPQNLLPHAAMNPDPQSTFGQAGDQNNPNQGFPGANWDPRINPTGSGMGSAKGERPKVDMMPLIQLITTSIAPGTWRVHDNNGQDVSAAYGLGGGFGGDAGGIDTNRPPGAITPFFLSISLIIRHTSEVHEQVADLLRQLRRLQDLQVSIEVRFITVADNFFEFIGVDFDFQIQSDTVGKHATFATPNPAAALFPIPGVTTGIITGTSTSTSTTTGTGTTGTTGTTGGGGTTGTTGGGGGATGGGGGATGGGGGTATGGGGGTATGGGGTSTSTGAVAPNAYLINPIRDHAYPNQTPLIVGTAGGGLANFSPNLNLPYTGPVSNLVAPALPGPGGSYQTGTGGTFGIAFLSDLEVYLFLTAAQGDVRSNVLQAPKVTTFNGAPATIFNNTVQYYVQALLPIVGPGAVAYTPVIGLIPTGQTLTVTPVVSADRRYVRLTLTPFFNALNSLQTFTFGGAGVGGGFGGSGVLIQTTVQLPNTSTTTITTTVTVPDGGTVLLGGVKLLNEIRNEFGVPFLSKIPMIDRLFRNIGIARTSSSLMLMVTPRIVILEEEEEKLGIPSVAL